MVKIVYLVDLDPGYFALNACEESQWKGMFERFRPDVRVIDKWARTRFYADDPLAKKQGDFCGFGFSGFFGIREPVFMSKLGLAMGEWGEFLEAELEDPREKFWIYNLLTCYNCLDTENTVFRKAPRSDVVLGIEKYSFKFERIGSSLFKIPEFPCSHIFAASGLCNDDDFVEIYRSCNFTGLRFEEVWRDV